MDSYDSISARENDYVVAQRVLAHVRIFLLHVAVSMRHFAALALSTSEEALRSAMSTRQLGMLMIVFRGYSHNVLPIVYAGTAGGNIKVKLRLLEI